MLPADDWQQCGLTDLSDLHSQSHTVCKSQLQFSAKVASRENQDPVNPLFFKMKASQSEIVVNDPFIILEKHPQDVNMAL